MPEWSFDFSFCCMKYSQLILCWTSRTGELKVSLKKVVFFGHSAMWWGIHKQAPDRLDLILTSVAVENHWHFVSLLPGFQLFVVCFWFLFPSAFLFVLAGKNGCRREVEMFGFKTAQWGWRGRWKGTGCASEPAAGWARKIYLCGALWDIPCMALPWRRAKVFQGVARGEERRCSSSDGAGSLKLKVSLKLKLGECKIHLTLDVNSTGFLSYTFKPFILQHNTTDFKACLEARSGSIQFVWPASVAICLLLTSYSER